MTDTMQYGPQTAEVEALIERARALSDAEVRALGAAWEASRNAAWDEALDAARYAMHGTPRDSEWESAWGAINEVGRGSERYAVQDAALCLIARDLITPEGFTQADYDLLTGPWRKVIGRVRPDDEEVVA